MFRESSTVSLTVAERRMHREEEDSGGEEVERERERQETKQTPPFLRSLARSLAVRDLRKKMKMASEEKKNGEKKKKNAFAEAISGNREDH